MARAETGTMDGGEAVGVETDESVGRTSLAWLSRHRSALAIAAALVVLALASLALTRLTTEVRYADVLAAFEATTWAQIGLAVLFTALSFAALGFYDSGALAYAGSPQPYARIAPTALCAYAVGNTAGFGPLSGGAIRYRGYSRLGIAPEDVARVIAFVTLAFGLGLLTVASLAALGVAERAAPLVGMSATVLRVLGLVGLLPLVALLILGGTGKRVHLGRFAVRLPARRAVLRQLLVTAVDVAASGAVLYVLLPQTAIGFPTFICLYAVAIGAGVLSHVPAGLGVFETMIVAMLGAEVGLDRVLGALVLYRVIYYLLPLLVAAVFVTVAEIRGAVASPRAAEMAQTGQKLAPLVLATLAFVLGTMLILSSVVPTPSPRLEALRTLLPLPLVEGAHFLSSLVGLVLLVSARGLAQRLDGAWLATLAAAVAALVLALFQAMAFHEAALLGLFAVALVATRKSFDRPASMLRQALTLPWLAAIATICLSAFIVLLFVYRDVDYANELWWQFEFASEAPRSLRALLGVTILASAIAIWSLVRPAIGSVPAPDTEALARAETIVERQDDCDGNLVRMADKSLLFSADGKAFIMYARKNRSMIALFDPIGPRESWAELVWSFTEMARGAGCRAVFYQVSPTALSLYADAGMQAFKLGELAMVDLTRFDLTGGKRAGLRQAKTRGARDGLVFSVLAPAEVPAAMEALADVSDAWLARHDTGEKAFSLGAFDPAYLAPQPVAVLEKAGRIVAFANIMITDTRAEASVDLMRFHPDAPGGAMDFLFVCLMEHLKAEGYRRFNMGMAPLSGMSGRLHAPIWDRIGKAVFEHGEKYYNFKGLRAFKAKFHPDWQPRYMTTSGGISPALALVDATLLIGRGFKGVVRR